MEVCQKIKVEKNFVKIQHNLFANIGKENNSMTKINIFFSSNRVTPKQRNVDFSLHTQKIPK